MSELWELHDGTDQVGPLEEAHVIAMIRNGIPSDIVVRRVGDTDWNSLRSHAPFAIALGQIAAASGPPPVVAPVYVDAPPIQIRDEGPSAGDVARVGAGVLLSATRIVGALLFVGGVLGTVPGCLVGSFAGLGAALVVAIVGLIMTRIKRIF
jgi:hypothetical protein